MNVHQETKLSRQQLNANFAQQGIAFFPAFGHFTTIYLKDDQKNIKQQWLKVVKEIDTLCAQQKEKTVCVFGVDYELWQQWCDQDKMPAPQGTTDFVRLDDKPFANTRGDLWFHIKGTSAESCALIYHTILKKLKSVTRTHTHTPAHKQQGGKVFGGRFIDAMINPVDQVNLSERVIVGEEDLFYRGSAYVLQQKFVHNWAALDNMSMVEKEDMIGRNHNQAIIPMHDERSHIKCVRQLNGERVTQRILRQALPFGHSDSGAGKEEGVYFVAYGNDGNVFEQLIKNIVGSDKGFVKDKMLSNSQAITGNFWFVPAAELIGLSGPEADIPVPLNDYYNVRSDNGLMFYNNRDFLNKAQSANANDIPISDRIMLLLGQTFSEWNDTWEKKKVMPPLGHLKDHVKAERWQGYKKVAKSKSAALRKGLAIKISLSDTLLRPEYREKAGLYNIKPNEIIIGNMPPLTLGTGTQVMEYLTADEKIEHFFGNLNEYSATGHNIPNYHKVIRLGIGGMIEEAQLNLDASKGEKKAFYQSVLWALEGLQAFILAHAKLAEEKVQACTDTDLHNKEHYAAIAARMEKLAYEAPQGLLESLQLIFIVNCALHQSGEPMSIGRLDQYLIEPYEQDIAAGRLTQPQAQEIIDAFWLKMDETVLYNRQHMEDYLNYGTGAVFYSAGNFPQGSALNQWVQQVTIGGYLPTNSKKPKDGCNDITLMCLRSARRLPLNAPCLSLRVHQAMKTPLHEEILQEAAMSIMSGGADPILMNDDKLVKGLMASGPLQLADARDYVCDGCYEPIIGGKSEWAFSYVPILPVVGMAMNQGATIAGAGWQHLRGIKTGWNSPAPEQITSFDHFMEIFFTQYKWQISKFYNTLMNSYGALWDVRPSPLFSAMTDGCMESGKDMTNGGAEYHIVAPMMCGITDTINALYAIKKMVFDQETAVTTLPELLQALWNNWGEDMQEPFHNVMAGNGRTEEAALRYKQLRQAALALPKFGEGNSEDVKALAQQVVQGCVDIIHDGINKPVKSVKKAYKQLQKQYDLPERKFEFVVTPGVGTFEDNLGLGSGMGASPDGRLAGDPIADDFCAAPSPADQPPKTEAYDIYQCLQDWNIEAINVGLSNAAPIDLNIKEDFPVDELTEVIRQFADSKLGSNLLTFTTADPETYKQAETFPEKYDLVRVRQGGWSEFYIAMFPEHQKYISRRRFYEVKSPGKTARS
ncbi:Dyp-type peroxidase [Oceanospirillum beijerinckii]|uniref:Dyp-type peroxidase n=1 Tax=Oceanospirillum beijerinckii TaxID=64976 RepID=UPI00040DCA07|nr:Dyp-type peroxidase [Oceanospirillum beijerinckii]